MNTYSRKPPPTPVGRIILILCGLVFAQSCYADTNTDRQFEQAISAARSGNFDRALPILKRLTEAAPDNNQYLHDYITVLSWAERYDQALAFIPRIDLDDTPDYVLQSLTDAAIALLDFDTGKKMIARLSLTAAEIDEYHHRLAWKQIESGNQHLAFNDIQARSPSTETYINNLFNLSDYLQDKNAAFARLIVLNKLATLSGDVRADVRTDKRIDKAKLLVLRDLNATHLAKEINSTRKGLLSPTEQASLDGDVITTHIAWSQLPNLEHTQSFYESDLAIRLLRQQLEDLQSVGLADSPASLRARFDLLAALHDRGYDTEVIQIHQQLIDEEVDIPDYALISIAGAYQSLHKPVHARAIYEKVLMTQTGNNYIRTLLYYCLLDLEDYDRAIQLIDDIAASEQPWLCNVQAQCSKNNSKLQADIAAAMVRAYAEHPDEAEQRILPLYNEAPFNLDLQQARATLQYWRNRPHQSLNSLNIIAAQEPLYFDAASSRFGLNMAMMDYRAAYTQLGTMAQLFGDHKRLDNSVTAWLQHNRRELNIDINRSTNTSSVDGSRDLVANTHLYNQPYKFSFRPFLHSYNSQSKIPEGYAHYHRLGIGLEYRIKDLRLLAELHNNTQAGSGLSLDGYWTPIDHWAFGAHADSNTLSIPLRGRFNENITGHSIGIESSYLHDESLRIDGSYQHLAFSDSNTRKNKSLSIEKRFIAKPHYFLHARMGYFGSSNTRIDAPYYNPTSDRSLELILTNEWIQYRFYSDSMRHRLVTSIGQYSQSDFSTKGIGSISYEQQWNLFESTELVYGLGRAQRSYDAHKEFGNWFTLRLNWRF